MEQITQVNCSACVTQWLSKSLFRSCEIDIWIFKQTADTDTESDLVLHP